MKEEKDRAKIKKGSKRMDIEEIVNALSKEKISNVKWTGKMPKGVCTVEKQPHPFQPSVNRQMTIKLKDRIDYDLIKKLCESNNLSISTSEMEMDEKGRHPLEYTIYSRGATTEMKVNEDSFMFLVDEYERNDEPRQRNEIPLKVREQFKKLDQLNRKIEQKMMEVIKKYLSIVYGGA